MSAILRRPATPIHSPRERERLQTQLKHLENRLQGQLDMPTNRAIKEKGITSRRKGFYEQFMWKDVKENQEILKRQIARAKETLSRGQPRPLSRTERAQVEKQRQMDAEFLKKNLTPKQLYYAKPNTPEFNQGKKVCRREISAEIQSVKDRYIQATRRLDPDNDSRDLIESLRPGS
jgi:hypothetical protein